MRDFGFVSVERLNGWPVASLGLLAFITVRFSVKEDDYCEKANENSQCGTKNGEPE